MELNMDQYWTQGYNVGQMSNDDHALLWSMLHQESWLESVLPKQKVVSWSNNVKTKQRKDIHDQNKDEWPMHNKNIPLKYMDTVNDIWNRLFFNDYHKQTNKNCEIMYIDVWNGTPEHEWHNHAHEGIDAVFLMYLTDCGTWDYDWGGVLHIGNKIIETNDVSVNGFILPNNKTCVVINNTNPKIVHSVTEQVYDANRYTIGTGIKIWN